MSVFTPLCVDRMVIDHAYGVFTTCLHPLRHIAVHFMFVSQAAVGCRLRFILRIWDDFGGELAAFIAAEVRQGVKIHSGIPQLLDRLRRIFNRIIHLNGDMAAARKISIGSEAV